MVFVVKLVLQMVINKPKKHGYYTFTIIQPWSLTHTDSLSSLCSCVSVSQDSLSVHGGGALVPPHELLHQTAGQRGGSSSSPGCYYRRRGAREEDQPSGTHTHTHTLTHTHTHTVWSAILVGTLHRRNGFYTVQTVFSIALHQPYT